MSDVVARYEKAIAEAIRDLTEIRDAKFRERFREGFVVRFSWTELELRKYGSRAHVPPSGAPQGQVSWLTYVNPRSRGGLGSLRHRRMIPTAPQVALEAQPTSPDAAVCPGPARL